MRISLRGSPIERRMGEITCGGEEPNPRVVVPPRNV